MFFDKCPKSEPCYCKEKCMYEEEHVEMETKDFGYDKNVVMKEVSDTVFEKISNGEYRCIKNRDGSLIVGGIYTPFFVDSYASLAQNVVRIKK